MASAALSGLFTALITPFKGGKVDARAFQSLVEWQVKQGVSGVVPCGTTGESPTLSHDEHMRVVEMAVEAAAGKIAVMAGTGSNSTDEAIAFTRHAKKAGASSALVVAPYYNKPTQEGLYQHFKAINDAVKIPIIVYNIPGRSVVNITDETLARLAKLPNIAGIKDATGDLARVSTLRQLVDKNFSFLSGEDMTAVGFNAMGGNGCISVTSNIAPKQCAEVQKLCLAGKYKEALKAHEKLVKLHQVMFCETSPSPVKYAASLMKLCGDEIRMPLMLPSTSNQKLIRDTLKSYRLIK